MQIRLALLAGSSLALLACGSSPPAKSAMNETLVPAVAPSNVPDVPVEKTTQLRRSAVKKTISRGLGYFLQGVSLDDYPVMKEGKFYGFKIKQITPEWGIDLRPGDVVTRVNGMAIEHPDEADAAMRSLERASALRVDFDRDGKRQILELPIVEE
ncbi:MAG: hypothetical protein KF819_15800 [Labilithrix sp.]|nr:hypothetical protein [Labilithrix sp.]